MVTPRKPGARRGRPPVAWTKDPHRYAVALLDALLALEMASERQCALLAAAIMLGERVEKISLDALNRHPGMIEEAYDKAFGSGESTATFEGRAATLRQKYRAKCNPATAQWRIAMAGIFMLVVGAKDREKVKREALARAAEIGEEAFVRDVLLLNF